MTQVSPTRPPVRVGTRGSQLALWQAEHVAERIRALGYGTEIVRILTRGDRDQTTELHALGGGKGIFVKEIEEALLAGTIDVAVHSMKDLPTSLPAGLGLVATLERETPLDAWICPSGHDLLTLPAGARVATGSLRRGAQVLALRPDLQLVPLRGNVPTRLRRVSQEGLAEATLLAGAGLRRLGLAEAIGSLLPPEQVTPAMGQGALALEARVGELAPLWRALNHVPTRLAVDAERAFLAELGGGCNTPAGILVRPLESGAWSLIAMLSDAEGSELQRRSAEVATPAEASAQDLGALLIEAAVSLARELLAAAGPRVLATLQHLPGWLAQRAGRELAGWRLILTRPASESEAMAQALEATGVCVDRAPVIEFTSFIEANLEHIARILLGLRDRGGWLVLPSPTAIRHFIEVLARLALPPETPNHLRIATVGRAGLEQLGQAGIEADFVSPEPRAATLAATLPLEAGQPVLIAGSSQTRPELAEGLEQRGARVQMLPLYAPQPHPMGLERLRALLRDEQDAGHAPRVLICLTSPSAVDAVADAFMVARGGTWPQALTGLGWIAIGPTTARHLHERGFPREFIEQAHNPDADGILAAARTLARRLVAATPAPPPEP